MKKFHQSFSFPLSCMRERLEEEPPKAMHSSSRERKQEDFLLSFNDYAAKRGHNNHTSQPHLPPNKERFFRKESESLTNFDPVGAASGEVG